MVVKIIMNYSLFDPEMTKLPSEYAELIECAVTLYLRKKYGGQCSCKFWFTGMPGISMEFVDLNLDEYEIAQLQDEIINIIDYISWMMEG